MIIDVGVEVFLVEFIDQWCPFLRDVVIAQMLADNGAVLAFYQRIVVAPAGAGLGEFDQQFVEQICDTLVDVL